MANIEYQRVNGDFRVDAGGNITLATQYLGGGPGIYNGNVTILGNLVITGSQTTVETSNITLTDRIITLNVGDPGLGVTLGTAGIEINRGTGLGKDSTWLWDESQSWTYNNVTNQGMWTAKVAGAATGVVTNAIRTLNGTNLSLLGSENPAAVVSVEGTINYYQHVTDPNHIPNKQYVDNAIFTQPDRSRLEIYYATSPSAYHADASSLIWVMDATTPVSGQTPAASEPQIRFQVNSNQWSTMYSNRWDIGQLRITNTNTITTNTNGINIVLSTNANSGSVIKPDVEIVAPLKLDIDTNYSSTYPAYTNSSIKIYAKAEGAGGTGIYFVNSANTRDELPSKRRAFFASLVL